MNNDWDHTETPEEEAARREDWLTNNRAVWFIEAKKHGKPGEMETEEWPLFVGIWRIDQDYDEDTGQMILKGLPDFPVEVPIGVEIHKIPEDERPDRYQPKKYMEHRFSHVLVIRALDRTIERRRKVGKKTIITLSEEEKINHLRLSGRLDDF